MKIPLAAVMSQNSPWRYHNYQTTTAVALTYCDKGVVTLTQVHKSRHTARCRANEIFTHHAACQNNLAQHANTLSQNMSLRQHILKCLNLDIVTARGRCLPSVIVLRQVDERAGLLL